MTRHVGSASPPPISRRERLWLIVAVSTLVFLEGLLILRSVRAFTQTTPPSIAIDGSPRDLAQPDPAGILRVRVSSTGFEPSKMEVSADTPVFVRLLSESQRPRQVELVDAGGRTLADWKDVRAGREVDRAVVLAAGVYRLRERGAADQHGARVTSR